MKIVACLCRQAALNCVQYVAFKRSNVANVQLLIQSAGRFHNW